MTEVEKLVLEAKSKRIVMEVLRDSRIASLKATLRESEANRDKAHKDYMPVVVAFHNGVMQRLKAEIEYLEKLSYE